MPIRRLIFLASALSLISLHQAQAETTKDPHSRLVVELITAGPGGTYWESFGHNAISIRDPESGWGALYNYGIFDFRQENFLLNFVRGKMLYQMAAFDIDEEITRYMASNRTVLAQTLNLTANQKKKLVDFLEENRRPENSAYLYDYFLDNCSTRVRDALDYALDGTLSSQFRDMTTSHTFRSLMKPYTVKVPWMHIGANLAIGRPVDRPVSQWDTFYLPDFFAAAIFNVQIQGTRETEALVSASRTLHTSTTVGQPSSILLIGWTWVLPAAVAAALAFGVWMRPWILRLWWSTTGVIGATLLIIWLATDHWAARWNENILLFTPLALLLAFARSGDSLGPKAYKGTMLVLASLAMAVILKLGPGGQDNWLFLPLVGLIQVVACTAVIRRYRRRN